MNELTPAPALVQLQNLSHRFSVSAGWGRRLPWWALWDVSLSIRQGETCGLVGESGCGKTTLGRCAVRLLTPTRGRVLFAGQDISRMTHQELMPVRRRMQIVFQDPLGSLNPRLRVCDMLSEPIRVHRLATGSEVADRVCALLAQVGLSPNVLSRYPHEFSSGQRQRLSIARALSVAPDFLVADEPVSSVDVSLQAQILNLLLDLKESLSLTYLLISHNLQVIRAVADSAAVMYCGRLVEVGAAAAIFDQPRHPYTQALLAATPRTLATVHGQTIVRGEPPSPLAPPTGCSYHPRCPTAIDRCRKETPVLRSVDRDRQAACHLCDSAAYVI